jgi:heat shock protein HslJ
MKALILTLTLILSGCSLLSGGASASLDGEWRLQAGINQGGAVPIVDGSQITMKIDGTQVGGSAACNLYGGTIQADGSSVTISALSMTEMACQENLMAAEAAYLAALPRVTKAERSGDSLVLNGPQVELSYLLVPPVGNANLTGTVWVLESLISGDAVASTLGVGVTLEFNPDGTLAASTGCRMVTGRYTISGNEMQVTLDPHDLIGCVEPMGWQDTHVLAVISERFSIAIDGRSLTLTAGNKGLGYRAS